MTNDEKQKIRDEARANLADKSHLQRDPPPSDPLLRWRQEAEQFAREAEQAKTELRAEEQARTAQRQTDAAAWDDWFVNRLYAHLPKLLEPQFEGTAKGVAELYAELAKRLDAVEARAKRAEEENIQLRTEFVKLLTAFAELRCGFPPSDTTKTIRNNVMPGNGGARPRATN
jgi:hypothetical protein